MKLYFVASSRLVGADPKLYSKMYSFLSAEGKMLSDKVQKWIKTGAKDLSGAPQKIARENYIQSLDSVKKADIVVMEVSGHSMSMGYLISKALEMNKPVIETTQEIVNEELGDVFGVSLKAKGYTIT